MPVQETLNIKEDCTEHFQSLIHPLQRDWFPRLQTTAGLIGHLDNDVILRKKNTQNSPTR